MTGPDVRVPLWTRARLERVMRLRFGEAPRGGVDTVAVAAAMGVSRRTVQRWLHARSGRALTHLPAGRRQQLIELLRPSAQRLQHEDDQQRYAAGVVAGLVAYPDEVQPGWLQKRWLEPHLVVILEVQVTAHSRIRQVTTLRNEPERLAALRRRGRVVAVVPVPTNFHATLLIHRVLRLVGPWRYQAQPKQVKRGWTATWTTDAPHVTLGEVWNQVRADVPGEGDSTPSSQ